MHSIESDRKEVVDRKGREGLYSGGMTSNSKPIGGKEKEEK